MNQIGLLLEPIRRKHVLKAIEKFNELGRDEFLKEYKFGKAKTCWLIYKEQPYDSKAIVGVAYGFATDSDPLTPYDNHFYGGDPVLRKLSSLGFECKKGSRPNSQL